jgi:hypothetical protein
MYGYILHNAVARRMERLGFVYHPNQGPDYRHAGWGMEFDLTTRAALRAHRVRPGMGHLRRWHYVTYRRRW